MDPAIFDSAVGSWQQYQTGPAGRIRGELLWRALARHLPLTPLRVLDAGGGTGDLAVRLAEAGHTVTLVDFSPGMVAVASSRAADLPVRCVCERVEALDPDSLGRFDLIACHSVLEFVDDPHAVIDACRRCLLPGGRLSIAFGNARYAPLKVAILEHDFDRARCEALGRSDAMDCFGLPKRLFAPESIRTLLTDLALEPQAEYGIRVVTDLLPPAIVADPDRFETLLALETQLMATHAFAGIARYLMIVAASNDRATRLAAAGRDSL